MRVFVTGNMGYIGPVLTRFLRVTFPNIEIIGFDAGFFGHSLTCVDCMPEQGVSVQYFGDVRDIQPAMLDGVDAVVHLAGISNDPIGDEFESVTDEINRRASVRLAEMASYANVKNFVFASSCSAYGQTEGLARKETDPTMPLTAYARSKIGAEDDLKKAKIGDMVFTSLRFATACGWSTRLRLDLVLNDFVASAVTSGEIRVLSDGSPWRPLIDVEDMARAIAWAISRDSEIGGSSLIVNVGSNNNNYRIKHLAKTVASLIPNTQISVNEDARTDNRSYSVDFSLYASLAPAFQPVISLEQSIDRLRDGLLKMKFDEKDFRKSSYMRLNTLRTHIAEGRLGKDLRWKKNF